MSSYLYSKLRQPIPGEPVEFYSELDSGRYETRKIEIFEDGRSRHASTLSATQGSRLSTIPIPPKAEIESLAEFETREISQGEFEEKWSKVTKT